MKKKENPDFPNQTHRLIVLDDDPTGIQTVHDCLVLTVWDDVSLQTAFQDEIPFFFILTNTRALTAEVARKTITDVVTQVMKNASEADQKITFLFRSDSTLRGHFPLELETIVEVANLKTDARFFVAAFFEGGRITENNQHYLLQSGNRIPCDQTEFARDSVFGYSTSHLPDYIHEKTSGRIKSEMVLSIGRNLLDGGHEKELDDLICSLHDDSYVLVNATNYDELNRFGTSLKKAIGSGKEFIFQSSASLVKTLSGCLNREYYAKKTTSGPGLIIIGSHVDKTTLQLNDLRSRAQLIKPIGIDVSLLLENPEAVITEVQDLLAKCGKSGHTPVLYTSRNEIAFKDKTTRLAAGLKISEFFNHMVKTCPFQPSFCISKGGITSHEILARGLDVRIARVLGQAAAGIPVIEMPSEHRWSKMPFVIFPGNVGEDKTLTEVYQRLSATQTLINNV